MPFQHPVEGVSNFGAWSDRSVMNPSFASHINTKLRHLLLAKPHDSFVIPLLTSNICTTLRYSPHLNLSPLTPHQKLHHKHKPDRVKPLLLPTSLPVIPLTTPKETEIRNPRSENSALIAPTNIIQLSEEDVIRTRLARPSASPLPVRYPYTRPTEQLSREDGRLRRS